MRQCYDAMHADCPIPRLWGLNLLGTWLRVYCGDVHSGAVQPEFEYRPSHDHTIPRDFLAGAWSMDILSQEGFARMQEIVGDILASVDNGCSHHRSKFRKNYVSIDFALHRPISKRFPLLTFTPKFYCPFGPTTFLHNNSNPPFYNNSIPAR